MTHNTLGDLRSLEQAAEDVHDKYFLGLCTLFVATIEDAKDRISQLELVFCSQLFPAFQTRLADSSNAVLRAENLHDDAREEWEMSREALLRELQELRMEEECRTKLYRQEQENLRVTFGKEMDEIKRQLLVLQQENKTLIQQKSSLEERMQKTVDEVEATRPRQEIFSKCCCGSYCHMVQASSSSETSPKPSENAITQLPQEQLEQRTSIDCTKRQPFPDEAVQKDKLASHSALVKLHALKKRYRSLKKQYHVLFHQNCRTKSSQNPHQGDVCEHQEESKAFSHDYCNKGRTPNMNSMVRERSKFKCNCKKEDTSTTTTSASGILKTAGCSNYSSGPHNRIAATGREIQEASTNVNTRGEVGGEAEVEPSSDLLHPYSNRTMKEAFYEIQNINVLKGGGNVAAEETILGTPLEQISSERKESSKGSSLEGELHQEQQFGSNPEGLDVDKEMEVAPRNDVSSRRVPLDGGPVCDIVAGEGDKEVEGAPRNDVPSRIVSLDSGPVCDIVAGEGELFNAAEGLLEGYAKRRSSGASTRKALQLKDQEPRSCEAVDAGWFPPQKRAFPNKSPQAVKSSKRAWRNTRARDEGKGLDPHDSFLNTPHEAVLKHLEGHVVDHHQDSETLEYNVFPPQKMGGLDIPLLREKPSGSVAGRDVSDSQVTTQGPDASAGYVKEECESQSPEKLQHNQEPSREPSSRVNNGSGSHKPGPKEQKLTVSCSTDKASIANDSKMKLPSKLGPMYKYVETVRKKDDREKLQGVECNQCKKFYDAVLTKDGGMPARCEHHDAVSRHRYRYVPPATPEGFWNIGFDSEV